MTNDEAYAEGLLLRALDPANQPDAIRAFLADEQRILDSLVPSGAAVLDLGCGTGRHLAGLAPRIRMGVGVDYEMSYLLHARRTARPVNVYYVMGDATAVPLAGPFDVALCLTGTWGTMTDKEGVLAEMRRLAPTEGRRILTVYRPDSVEARIAWYANLGHPVVDVADGWLRTEGGFTSEHFTEKRIRDLMGPCRLHPLGDIAFMIEA